MRTPFRLIAAARAISAVGLAAFVVGCVTSDKDAARAVASLRSGQNADAIAWSEELATDSHYSKNLGLLEAGRCNMLAGRTAEAENWFRAAVDGAVDRQETAPKIKLGDVGNEVLAGTVTDDRTREYYISPYELNLALEYGILLQEANGKRADALADCRLAVYVQDHLAEAYGADAAAAEAKADKAAQGVLQKQSAALDPLMAGTRNSWENPVLWWLTGVLFEADGDWEMAAPSYRKAAAIAGENPFFAADAKRALDGKRSGRENATVVLVCGEDFVPPREALKVPVPIYTAMSIDIPIYRGAPYAPGGIRVSVDGRDCGTACPALNVQALAARDLREHLPGIITRNISRALVQAGAQAAVNCAGNDYAKIAMFVGNAVVSAIRRADTRSWVTLPKGEQVWCARDLKPGEHEFKIDFNGKPVSVTAKLSAGETKVLYVQGR